MNENTAFSNPTKQAHQTGPLLTRRSFLTRPASLAGIAIAFPSLLAGLLHSGSSLADDSAAILNPLYYPLEAFTPEIDLAGKLAIITGASRGIGRATAETLMQWGVEVIGTSRDAAHVPDVPNFHLMDLDITDDNSVKKFTKALERQLNGRKIDILINNAGRFVIGPMLSIPRQSDYYFSQLQLADETLHHGHVHVTQALLPLMPTSGYARVLFTVSSAGYMVGGSDSLTPWIQPYISAKRALLAYANSFRSVLEQASSNIRVSTVNPYVIATQGAEHPNPIYMQEVADTGFTEDPPDAPFNQVLSLIRQLQANGLPPAFVGETYAQLLASSVPPANVVVASSQYPFNLQGGNDFVEALILGENQQSAIHFDCG